MAWLKLLFGASKGVFLFARRGRISMSGGVRAPVTIINFAYSPCEDLWTSIGFNKRLPHKNYCKPVRAQPRLLRFPPPAKPLPLEAPDFDPGHLSRPRMFTGCPSQTLPFWAAFSFLSQSPNPCPPPPRENITKIIRPEYSCISSGGRLQQNCVITKKLIPQELFCVIGDRRDIRLVHAELREIYVTPKKIFLRYFFA